MAFGSFYSGLSGLQANSARLGVIGNNLANVSTIGFKSSRVTFQDIFSQSGQGAGVNGAGNPQQVGLGVQMGGIQQMFGQGSLQSTGLVTDLAIQGNGFFVLADRGGGRSFSRAGNFTFDRDGDLITQAGQLVQGYTQRDAAGNITSSAGALGDIRIPVGLTAPPRATTSIEAVINLSAEAVVDDPLTTLDESSVFSTTLTVYDSLGGRHNLTLSFVPVDTDADGARDGWDWEASVPGEDVAGGTPGTPSVIGSGTVTFAADGTLASPTGNVALALPAWANGAGAQSVDWALFNQDGSGNLTGYSGASATSSSVQDGYTVGQLRSLTVDTDGLVAGIFTNGATLELARIGLATFNNPNGLLKNGQNSFLETNVSGLATIGSANSGGRGSLAGSALELSNVDITQEFTDLIITERGYQANSRTITTTDQIIQEALNLKR